jgi:hypothetical protein
VKFHRVVAAQAATKWRPIRARARSEWNKRCGANAFEKVQMQFLASLLLRGAYFFLLRQKSKKNKPKIKKAQSFYWAFLCSEREI